MSSISKIKFYILVWLVCIVAALINTTPVIAQDKQTSPEPSPDKCVSCDDVPITCPSCAEGTKCILTLRTCFECPKPKCIKQSPDNKDGSKKDNLLPAVIGGSLGFVFLVAMGYGFFVWRRRARNQRGIKLDGNDEMVSLNGENIIPIAYIPPTTPSTPTTPKPEPTYPRLRVSNISGGTTPLASPLPYNLSDEQLINIADDDDIASDAGTILQATKTPTATTPTTATIVTATRAKPALVRLNTIKQASNKDTSSAKSTRSESSIPNTPKTPLTGNTLLYAPSISSVPSSPISTRIGGDSDTEQMMPRIDVVDVERPSAESFRVTNQNISQDRISPILDPIEGRQSFGLFGSDEVYSNNSSSPQLQRESIMSSSSSNGRSTMFSDVGDGEITIFWGGNAPSFDVDLTNKDQNEEIKTKETV